MIKLIIVEYWNRESYPEHYSYKTMVYKDEDAKFASISRACDSKAETVAYIDGLQQAFRLYNENCEITYRTAEGDTKDYFEHFLSNNEYCLDGGSSRGDREDFHSDG